MNPDKIMDAIGMVDDRFLTEDEEHRTVPFRRKLITLIAAVLALALSVGTVMAAGQEFPKLGASIQKMFYTVFHIPTHEHPPEQMPNSTEPSQPPLQQIGVVDIDGVVNAHYFAGEGHVQRFEGGFYTYSGRTGDAPPEEYAFWEIRKEGIVDVNGTRVAFTFPYDGREFEIVFDYATVNGKLCVMVWPKGVGQDPYGNGWNVRPIGTRTDVALMQVPVYIDRDFTQDYLLLDLTTLETVDLFGQISMDHMRIDGCWFTDDLNYAIVVGSDLTAQRHGHWFCDLRQNTMTHIDDWMGFTVPQVYFLDDSTLICEQWLGDGRINVVRCDIPTGEKTVVISNVTRRGAEGGYQTITKAYGLLFAQDGSAELIDLRTGEFTALTGLSLENVKVSESPNSQSILIAYHERAKDDKTSWCYPRIGLLDPERDVVKLLTREISGKAEFFRGWLDDHTVCLTSHNDDGGYYVLVYEFKD